MATCRLFVIVRLCCSSCVQKQVLLQEKTVSVSVLRAVSRIVWEMTSSISVYTIVVSKSTCMGNCQFEEWPLSRFDLL